MSRRKEEGIKRYHVSLREDQWEKLEQFFSHNVGISFALRQILDSYLKRIEAKASASATPLSEMPHDDAELDAAIHAATSGAIS